MSEVEKQGILYNELFAVCERFKYEYDISVFSFLGVLDIYKTDALYYLSCKEKE